MASECEYGLFGDLFTENRTTMDELFACVHSIMQEDSNEMNPKGTEERQETLNNVVSNHETKRRCRWSDDEHERFLEGLDKHGKARWKEIAKLVGTRTPLQVATHAQKYFLRQGQTNRKRSSINDSPV